MKSQPVAPVPRVVLTREEVAAAWCVVGKRRVAEAKVEQLRAGGIEKTGQHERACRRTRRAKEGGRA